MSRGFKARVMVWLLVAATAALWHTPAAAAATATISGTVSTPAGPLVVATVMLRDADFNVYYDNVSAADEGAFSFTAPAGTYTLRIEGTTTTVGGVSSSFNWTYGNVNVSTDLDMGDLVVPARPVELEVVDGHGAPPDDVRALEIACDWRDDMNNPILYWNSGANPASSPTMTLWASPRPAGAVGEESTGCYAQAHRTAPNSKNQDFEVSTIGDNHVTLVIPDFVTISGTVTASDPRMRPSQVYAMPLPYGQPGGDQVAPAADGSYTMSIAPGEYAVVYSYDNADHTIGGGVFNLGVTAIEEPLTLNKHLATRRATVHVVDSAGQPVTGLNGYQDCIREVDLTISGSKANESFWTSATSTDIGGDHQVMLPATADDDPAWKCSFQLSSEEVYQRGPMPSDGADEMTLVLDSFGFFNGTPDGDAGEDGVTDLTEAAAPNRGDNNYDGVPDYEQDNVTSLPASGRTPTDNLGYVSIVGPAGSTLTGVSTMGAADALGSPPQGATLPAGLNTFTVEGIDPGSTQKIRIYAPAYEANAYAKYDSVTRVWSLLPEDRVLVNHDFTDWIEITLTDGGIGDADGVANGKILDPGGPAVVPVGDTTAPTVTGVATSSPNGAGWYRSDVRIDWSATDDSGVAEQPGDTIVSTQGSDVTATSPLVCDMAPTPNCGTGSVTGLKIDKTAPTLAIAGISNGATYTLGAVPAVTCTASDPLSGLAGPCEVTKTVGASNGVGPFTYTATVTDSAGNSRTMTSSYRVTYRFDGFLDPLNDPGPPVSIFKSGSTVPVAITLKRSNGESVTPAAKPVWVSPVRGARTTAPVNEMVDSRRGSSGNTFTFSNGAWRYNWSTKGFSAGYLYRIGVRLDDGTTHYLTVGVR